VNERRGPPLALRSTWCSRSLYLMVFRFEFFIAHVQGRWAPHSQPVCLLIALLYQVPFTAHHDCSLIACRCSIHTRRILLRGLATRALERVQ